MKEEIKFVGCTTEGEEQEYAVRYEDDCISIVDCITGKELLGGGWTANFRLTFKRALEIWPPESEA